MKRFKSRGWTARACISATAVDKKKLSPPPPASAANARRAPCSRKNCAVGMATSSSERAQMSQKSVRRSQWHCYITNVISPHGLPTHWSLKVNIPHDTTIPLTSDTPRLHQHVSRSPAAPRKRTSHPGRANPNGNTTSQT